MGKGGERRGAGEKLSVESMKRKRKMGKRIQKKIYKKAAEIEGKSFARRKILVEYS